MWRSKVVGSIALATSLTLFGQALASEPPPVEEQLPADWQTLAPDQTDFIYGYIPDDYDYGELGAERMLDDEPQDIEDSCRSYGTEPPPDWGDADPETHPPATFGFFEDPNDPDNDIALLADIYLGRGVSTTRGVVIMMYGGGWLKGCRHNVIKLANDFADEGFTVMAIDYRMTCTSSPHGPVSERCGFNAFSPDPIYNDVLKALAFARGDAVAGHTIHFFDPDLHGGAQGLGNKVFILGFSSGGHLAMVAGLKWMDWESGYFGMPDMVASWSGPIELGYLASPYGTTPACSKAYGPEETDCGTKRDAYANCDFYPAGNSGCAGPMEDASPYTFASDLINANDQEDIAPVFFANNTNELTPNEEGEQYDLLLTNEAPSHWWCLADADPHSDDGHLHATGLKNLECQDMSPSQSVEQWTIQLFSDLT